MSHVWSIAVEDDRSAFLILAHQTRVLKVCDQRILSLDASKGDFADFLAVELFPFFVVETIIEGNNRLWSDKVDESVSNIALVLKVDGKIEKVVEAFVVLIDGGEKHALVVFVGNVFDHESSSCLLIVSNPFNVKDKVGLVFSLVAILFDLSIGFSFLSVLPTKTLIESWRTRHG